MKCIIQILLICLLSSSANAIKSLPLTGKYSVGTKSYFIIDKNRSEILTKGKDDFRRIVIQVFYPSNKTAECSNRLQSPYGKKIKCNNCVDKAIQSENEKYPIVILSPGFGGSFLMNLTLAE